MPIVGRTNVEVVVPVVAGIILGREGEATKPVLEAAAKAIKDLDPVPAF